VKVGNLIRLTRAMIGVPTGSLGLLIKKEKTTGAARFHIWTVKFLCREHTRRLLSRDLEIVNS
jgi:hypothetical protein